MKTKLTILLMGLSFLPFFSLNAQSCGIKDPSIERHTSCPTTHSELALKSGHWFNDSIQEVGTYVYLIKAVNRDDENIVLKGNLSIVK